MRRMNTCVWHKWPARSRAYLIIYICSLFIGSSLSVFGENIDSLYTAAMSDNTISVLEAKHLLELLVAEEYADSSDLSSTYSLPRQQMLLHGYISEYFFDAGRFNLSNKASVRAVELARSLGDSTSLADCLSTLGCSAMRLANFDVAVSSFEECIALAERSGDMPALSSAYSNLASTYTVAATPENSYMDFAEKCIRKAIDIGEQAADSSTLSIRYGAATEILVKQGKYDEAIQMGRKAFELDSIAGNTLRMARRLSQTGDALFAKRDMKKAEQYYLRSMHLLDEVGDPLSISINCKSLGGFYLARGDRAKALSYLTRGLKMAEDHGNNNLRLALLQKMYQYYRGYDDAQSVHWLERYMTLKDSLYSEHNAELLNEYQERYKAAEQEIIISKQQQELRKQKFIFILVTSLLVIAIVFSLLIHRMRRHQKKYVEAEQEVRELKNIISYQEKRTIDQLTHYVALHINEKILTNEDICNHLAVSQSTLNRQLNAIKGVSIQGFVQQMRMEKAQHLLRTTKEPISDVAAQCGYDDATYFTRVFKQSFGVPPTKYRASAQAGQKV